MSAMLAEAFPAGEMLADELEARGWTQTEFAEILGRPPQFVSEIISGKKEITRESAAQIGAALGTTAEQWLNMQDMYFLWKQRQNSVVQQELEEVRLRARLKDLAPVAVLRKRGIVTASSTQGQVEQVSALFKMSSIFDSPQLPMAARRTNQAEAVTPTQMTWLACAYQKAENKAVPAYDRDKLHFLAEKLSQQVRNPAAFRGLPQLFAEAGVVLVYVEAFPASKIDGASFLMGSTPVIALSGRGQRLDKVLFTLLHEVAHVVLGHIDTGLVMDDAGTGLSAAEEAHADELAAQWIMPKNLGNIPIRINQSWVIKAAESRDVHPIVIIGYLQKTGALAWRTALVKGAPNVTQHLATW